MRSARHRLALPFALMLARVGHAAPIVDPTLAMSVDGAYDSNIYNGRGPDFVTHFTPRAAFRLRDERAELRLDYTLGVWVYARGKARNSMNHRATVVAEGQATRRLTLRLADEFVRAQDPGFLIRAGVVAPQTGIFDNFLEASARYRMSRRVDGYLSYQFHKTVFETPPDPSPPLFDGDEHDGTVGIAFRATRRDDIAVAHRFQYLLVDGKGLAITDSPSLAWRHQIARPLELRAEGGPLIYQGLDSARQLPIASTGTAVTWRASGLLRFYAPPWRAAVTAVRDLVSGTGAGSVLWADYVSAQFGVTPIRTLDLRAAVGVFENGPAPLGDRRYDGVTADGTVDVRLAPYLHLSAYYAFRFQESHTGDPIPNVTRHIVGLRLLAVLGAETMPHRREAAP